MKHFRLVLIIFSIFAIGMLAACEGDTGATGPAGPAGPSSTLGFASINLGDGPTASCIPPLPSGGLPCVYWFGGENATSVTVTHHPDGPATGDYEVRFFGSWEGYIPGESHRHDMTVLATVSEGDQQYVAAPFQATSGGAKGDSSTGMYTEIWTRVHIWRTSDLQAWDKDFSVVILR